MKLVTVAEMQAVEREANAGGLTYEMMMENAGKGLAEVVHEVYGDLKDKRVLGLVGSGNNGGDTLVALEYLERWGWSTQAYLARPRAVDDPLAARLQQVGGNLHRIEEDAAFEQLSVLLEDQTVVLDGILGTGMRLPLKPEIATVLRVARMMMERLDQPPQVVAVDCPSGVDCDSGEAAPECLPADLTVTMAAIKQGLLKFPAFDLVGALHVVGIGLPAGGETMASWKAIHRSVPDSSDVGIILPKRPAESHKGTFGTALVVAGSVNYTGAALLAGEAAYRVGAGLVTLAIPKSLHAALAGRFPEATWVMLPDEKGMIAEQAVGELYGALPRATALLVGPGFGLEETTGKFLKKLVEQELPPLVMDADGLKLLAQIPGWAGKLKPRTVLTPHPGEMSVLTGLTKDEIQANRLKIAEKYSKEWGHVVVLKGAFTIIAAPDGQTAMIPVATSALARAGTGDVLAGLIVGLLAQGVQPFPAAVAGAWIHAQAGLHAAEVIGNTASVLAGDVLEAVIDVISEVIAG